MAKMRIYIVDLESVPSRYTCEWKTTLPQLLQDEVKKRNLDIEIIVISGGEESIEATAGAFLNFQATNIYKNNQLSEIARRFTNEIKAGDKFLFADAWHTGILQLKYMSELLGIPVEIHGLWHAGSYDPQDFLGRLVKDKNWTYSTERAIYYASDYNWFATKFHKQMFEETLFDGEIFRTNITGWPMEYMPSLFSKYDTSKKEDIIIFPHRLAPEKQSEIFRDLAKQMPQYQFIVCQDNRLTKEEYHKLLAKSKLMWSANLQETLGITIGAEGPLCDVMPLAPDRLSYSEIFSKNKDFLYPSEWTENWNSYILHRGEIIHKITHMMDNYDIYLKSIKDYIKNSYPRYFSANELIVELTSSNS